MVRRLWHWSSVLSSRLMSLIGPIVCLTMFGKRVVMLNDPLLVMQLLEKRSSATSDRPQLVLSMNLYAALYRSYIVLTSCLGLVSGKVRLGYSTTRRTR